MIEVKEILALAEEKMEEAVMYLDEALAHIARYKRPIFPVEQRKSAIEVVL